MADHVVLKIAFEDQLRRTHLTRQPLSIEEVREQISRLFPELKYYTLSYVDEEGDRISVSTDMELQEAHRVCRSNIRLTLEKQNHRTPASLAALPSGSLLDHVSPSIASSAPVATPTPSADASSIPSSGSALLSPVGSILNYISPRIGEEDEELQKQLEQIWLQEKEEREQREREEKEQREREERQRIEREEKEKREREEKEKQEREERERIEREEKERQEREERVRIEREEKEKREREEKEKQEREEKERQEREEREHQEKLEQALREQADRDLFEKQVRLERIAAEQQLFAREEKRVNILQSNEKCGEILESLLQEGVELELAWQALEFANYSNEKRVRELLQMNELGIDFQTASDALTKYRTVNEAIDSLLA